MIPNDLVASALQEMYRTLKSPGELLLAFHIGDNIEHLDEFSKFTLTSPCPRNHKRKRAPFPLLALRIDLSPMRLHQVF